jgi:hypothetical protein
VASMKDVKWLFLGEKPVKRSDFGYSNPVSALVSHDGRTQASNQRVQRGCCYRGIRRSVEEFLRAAQEALDSLSLG